MIDMRPVANLGEKATIKPHPALVRVVVIARESVSCQIAAIVPNDLERAFFWTML